MPQHVMIVTTSHGADDATDLETGFDWQSIAPPYWRLREAGIDISFASPLGGKPPGNAATATDAEGEERSGSVDMFLGDPAAVEALAQSLPVAGVDPLEWDGILLTDGPGALWDFAQSEALGSLLATAWTNGGVLAAIGCGSAGLVNVATLEGPNADPAYIVSGRSLTCRSDTALRDDLGDAPPLFPESALRARNAQVYVSAPTEPPQLIEDGRLLTAQDARASSELAIEFLDALDLYAPQRAARTTNA